MRLKCVGASLGSPGRVRGAAICRTSRTSPTSLPWCTKPARPRRHLTASGPRQEERGGASLTRPGVAVMALLGLPPRVEFVGFGAQVRAVHAVTHRRGLSLALAVQLWPPLRT